MAAEILQQADAIARLVARRSECRELVAGLGGPPAGVLLVARGSSDNAAIYGRYLFEVVARCPACLAAASLHTRYDVHTRLSGWLVVAVSQSGETPELAEVLAHTRALGARSVAITNNAETPLAASADAVFELGVGVEHAVPATKTYTASLVALALLADALGDGSLGEAALVQLPDAVEETLERGEDLERAATLLADAADSVHLARGLLYGAALESALKVREAARLPVQGFAFADFLHGPVAGILPGGVALVHAGRDETASDAANLAADLARRGIEVVVMGADPAVATPGLDVPAVDYRLAPVVHGVRSQQLALAIALRRGLDPDSPAGLSKVTRTA